MLTYLNERRIEIKPTKTIYWKREDLKKFLQNVRLYLYVNEKVYDNDTKKISFALSFMNDGDAASYKEQLLEDALSKDVFTLGTWVTFKKELKEVF